MRRQLILFLAAILLPSVVLIALAVRLVIEDRQDRGEKQARAMAVKEGQELLTRLEAIRRDEVRGPLPAGDRSHHPETALVAWIAKDELVLPWEEEQATFRPEFLDRIHLCRQAEASAPDRAVDCYWKAAEAAADAVQGAFARLEWARALDSAGRQAEALPLFRGLLRAPPEAGDEDGVPVRLLAAQRLLESDADAPAALGAAAGVMAVRPWLPPLACLVAYDIADHLGGSAADWEQVEQVRRRASAQVRLCDEARALKSDFARTRLASRRPGLWITYGDEPWLVGVESRAGERAAVLAVRAARASRAGRSTLRWAYSPARPCSSPGCWGATCAANCASRNCARSSFPACRTN